MLNKNDHTLIHRIQPQTDFTAEQRLVFELERPSGYKEFSNKTIEKKDSKWAHYSSLAIKHYYAEKGIRTADDLREAFKNKDFLKNFRAIKYKYLKEQRKFTDHEITKQGLLRIEDQLIAAEEKEDTEEKKIIKKGPPKITVDIVAARKANDKVTEIDKNIDLQVRITRQLRFEEEMQQDVFEKIIKVPKGLAVIRAYDKTTKLKTELTKQKTFLNKYITQKNAEKQRTTYKKINEINKQIADQKVIIEKYITDVVTPELTKLKKDRAEKMDIVNLFSGLKDGNITIANRQLSKIKSDLDSLNKKYDKLKKRLTDKKTGLTRKTRELIKLENDIRKLENEKKKKESAIKKHENNKKSFKWFMVKHMAGSVQAQLGYKLERRKSVGDTVDQTLAKIYDKLNENLDNMEGSQKFWAFAGIMGLLVYLKTSKSEEVKKVWKWVKTMGVGAIGYHALNKGLAPLFTGKNISENLEDWRNKIIGETTLSQAFRNKGEKPEDFMKRMLKFKKALKVFKETGIPANIIAKKYYAERSLDPSTKKNKGEMYIEGLTPKRISKRDLYLACKTFFDKYPAKDKKSFDPPLKSNYYKKLSFADHIVGSMARDANIKIGRDPFVRFFRLGKRVLKSTGELLKKNIKDIVRSAFGQQVYNTGKSIFTVLEKLTQTGVLAAEIAAKVALFSGQIIKAGANLIGGPEAAKKVYNKAVAWINKNIKSAAMRKRLIGELKALIKKQKKITTRTTPRSSTPPTTR